MIQLEGFWSRWLFALDLWKGTQRKEFAVREKKERPKNVKTFFPDSSFCKLFSRELLKPLHGLLFFIFSPAPKVVHWPKLFFFAKLLFRCEFPKFWLRLPFCSTFVVALNRQNWSSCWAKTWVITEANIAQVVIVFASFFFLLNLQFLTKGTTALNCHQRSDSKFRQKIFL